jgi:hypothetical protein
MKGVTCYLENLTGDVLVVLRPRWALALTKDWQVVNAVGSRERRYGGEPASALVSIKYLRRCCARIRETEARERNPRLFEHFKLKPDPWPMVGTWGMHRWR